MKEVQVGQRETKCLANVKIQVGQKGLDAWQVVGMWEVLEEFNSRQVGCPRRVNSMRV